MIEKFQIEPEAAGRNFCRFFCFIEERYDKMKKAIQRKEKEDENNMRC